MLSAAFDFILAELPGAAWAVPAHGSHQRRHKMAAVRAVDFDRIGVWHVPAMLLHGVAVSRKSSIVRKTASS
jgi:hypothetical protein